VPIAYKSSLALFIAFRDAARDALIALRIISVYQGLFTLVKRWRCDVSGAIRHNFAKTFPNSMDAIAVVVARPGHYHRCGRR